ncbi:MULTISPECIES: hypothetical protein [Burkholderia]|uniref:Transposase n=1 Tax=Burkholderia lata (strain ATCC 17760 / DSM 23089 / LMG 22485 / NCIMB 9086 / R18194 / 383) TaxID=482957 RepID=A0A6P2PD83_BURL3|nr:MULTISPECIES: hypothetical protein [Burkholderia]MBN3795475.1 hypothetical protein [Burkholderia sp. Ac-20392]VWC05454.1 transposase [Burkholderia lata]
MKLAGNTVVRRGIQHSNRLLQRRKPYEGAGRSTVKADEAATPAREQVDALERIRELQRKLGRIA